MAVRPPVIYTAFTIDYHSKSNKLTTEISISDGNTTIKGIALWDTGATTSCISEGVVQQLNLIPTGMMNIQTPSSTKAVKTYLVNVGLPNHLKVNDIQVCETDIGKQGIEMLIGMDIITLGDFSVSNFNNNTVFSFRFPSKEKTDFVPQTNIDNILVQKHGKGKRKHRKK